ncbi:hypothetical protein [Brasilonema bromeliae]|nr:hypothetical protein [Brasilonema bromeliae]
MHLVKALPQADNTVQLRIIVGWGASAGGGFPSLGVWRLSNVSAACPQDINQDFQNFVGFHYVQTPLANSCGDALATSRALPAQRSGSPTYKI